MAGNSKIEWTDATWPVVKGCDYVSAGCANCYAADLIHRHAAHPNPKISLPLAGLTEERNGRARWTGNVYLNEPHMNDPLSWRKGRMVFVPSHGDLFHEAVPDEFILRVFDVMRRCTWAGGQNQGRIDGNGHTFQVLTKRAERMREFMTRLRWDGDRLLLVPKGEPFPPGSLNAMLEQIWLGVSVENQAAADERIPHLLATPAAVRFLSCEPLLGEVDLAGWGESRILNYPASSAATWAEYSWPEWVPVGERKLVEEFWGEAYKRDPRQWMESAKREEVPMLGAPIGATVRKDGWGDLCPARSPLATVTGRYVHMWNNIGRVVTADGKVVPVSSHRGTGWLSKWLQHDGSYRHRLHWVIAGGESGADARPMHPEWARSLRDQCKIAGVAFFFKQWGEFAPIHELRCNEPGIAGKLWINFDPDTSVCRIGKKEAGRALDGRTWDEFPRAAA